MLIFRALNQIHWYSCLSIRKAQTKWSKTRQQHRSRFPPSLSMLKSARRINEHSKLFSNWVYAQVNEIIARPLAYQPLDNNTLNISNTLPQKHILLINWHRAETLGCKLENIFRPCVQPTYAHQAHPLPGTKSSPSSIALFSVPEPIGKWSEPHWNYTTKSSKVKSSRRMLPRWTQV